MPGTAGAGGKADDRRAFVRVSPRDPRYFELSDGRPYLPIGLNMIAPPRDKGIPGMEEWFRKLSDNGGNYVRIWLGQSFFDVEHEQSGHYDAAKAQRIDELLALARRYGIRLKLCIDSFRHLVEGRKEGFAKRLHHVSQGGPATSTADFFDNPRCRQQYKGKLAWFAQRYKDEPMVFGWELWNEMDAIQAGDWQSWTREMLPELHRLFPNNLGMQSLGSYDNLKKRDRYRALATMPFNDVAQVHRYLDLGASWDVCHGPMDLLVADAVREILAFNPHKPVILAESGAVEPSHSGPFKLYEEDKAGILLHDVLFAPFFSGAAGPGHIWHWDVYVDRMDLWRHFGRFAAVVEGLDPPAEAFEPLTLTHPRLRVLALRGRKTFLAWCRDPENTWQSELAEKRRPREIRGESLPIDLPATWLQRAVARVYDPWTGRWTAATVRGNQVDLPAFSRSIVVRIEQ
jgi:hypothetical protein